MPLDRVVVWMEPLHFVEAADRVKELRGCRVIRDELRDWAPARQRGPMAPQRA